MQLFFCHKFVNSRRYKSMTTCKQYGDRDIHFFDRADKDALSDDKLKWDLDDQ
jgi:hypothetical protein